ncbi:putative aminophospholipid-translocase, variant 2 [Balamuthia mandrillaris]
MERRSIGGLTLGQVGSGGRGRFGRLSSRLPLHDEEEPEEVELEELESGGSSSSSSSSAGVRSPFLGSAGGSSSGSSATRGAGRGSSSRRLDADDKDELDGRGRRALCGGVSGLWQALRRLVVREPVYRSRVVDLSGEPHAQRLRNNASFPPNRTCNQKYNPYTFVPVVLYGQFKFFFNLYFLVVALSQFIPALQVGFLFTYIAPLAFVLTVTMLKEAYDDFKRWRRDQELNSQRYEVLTSAGLSTIPSSDIQVGNLIIVDTNQRVPTDMVFLRTTEKSGASFIRTDQLDGETDWKLRKAVPSCQRLMNDENLLGIDAHVYVEMPKKDIHNFVGTFTTNPDRPNSQTESLGVENMLWANTVVASGRVVGLTVYTGKETRAAMNTSPPANKVGLLDLEINRLAKILCLLLVFLSALLIVMKGFKGIWPIYLFRFMLLFSAIIPISLRVNLDMAKTVYSFLMMRDRNIPGTVVRTSTIPEELGRIEYLLSDKTGTLTQNDMVFKKLHLGSVSFSKESLEDIAAFLQAAYTDNTSERASTPIKKKLRHTMSTRIRQVVSALALCHNVTPVVEPDQSITYQASSPDEVALVRFTESVGLTLAERTLQTITLRTPVGTLEDYDVLNIFPFTSERKRMGIIVRCQQTGNITFYMKGADVVMERITRYSDWLDEECGNMSREGLRTLVFGMKSLTEKEYTRFAQRLNEAKTAIEQREEKVIAVMEEIETDLELLGLTGVEDKLQVHVRTTLEMLRNAGIKIWMLTGDKVETATCIAISSKLVSRTQSIFTLVAKNKEEAWQQLNTYADQNDSCLVIDGTSLQICLDNYENLFIDLACDAPSVVCCRCSPTQKAEIVKLLKKYTGKRTCAVGDGGNDVSMIQAADVGVGIVGKEGKQASLAADFSINQFSHLSRLLLWHGRNSYKRSARLSHFVIHRGLIISFIQAVFSALFYFAPIAIYNGWLVVGCVLA